MGVTFILVISILIQFAAAILALRLIRITGRRVAWVLIATALFFMAIRRCITLFQAEVLGVPYTTSMSAELVALVISILMLNGVIWIAPLFLSLKRSEEALRKARAELEMRVQERTVSLIETNQRLEQEITEHTKAKEALLESERDLNRAQVVAYTGSWRLDVQRNQLLWSDETHRIFGIPIQTPMTYETFLSCVHPEDREYVDQKWAVALKGEPYDVEHRIIVGDEVKWVRERAELEFDSKGGLKGGFGTVQDITERKQTEQTIRETKDYLENLIDYANAPIIVWNPKLEITRFNHAFEELTGRKADEMIGEKVDILIPLDNRVGALKMVNRTVNKGERWETVEIPVQHIDGSIRTILWNSATLFDVDGKMPLATIAQGQDITERKKVEQLKDEFIGLVSHELRTPLTVIHGCISTVLTEWERLPSGEVQQLLQDAMLESESLSHLIENLLELSRAQAQQLSLYSEPTDVKTLVKEAISKIKRQASLRRFVTSIPDRLPPINGDPLRIERILYNLLDNAAKYSPPGNQIKVSVNTEPERLVIGVSDHGEGLSSGEQAKIFGPFQRLEDNRPDQARGAGLGLMVCRRLVEAHGGEIWVESRKGKGSTFFFSLPLGKSTDTGRVSIEIAK
jgi:PAS domain S-box-containing protein